MGNIFLEFPHLSCHGENCSSFLGGGLKNKASTQIHFQSLFIINAQKFIYFTGSDKKTSKMIPPYWVRTGCLKVGRLIIHF